LDEPETRKGIKKLFYKIRCQSEKSSISKINHLKLRQGGKECLEGFFSRFKDIGTIEREGMNLRKPRHKCSQSLRLKIGEIGLIKMEDLDLLEEGMKFGETWEREMVKF